MDELGDWGLGMGIGDWGLGLGPIPNPQSPIPNPQSKIFFSVKLNKYLFHKNNLKNNIIPKYGK